MATKPDTSNKPQKSVGNISQAPYSTLRTLGGPKLVRNVPKWARNGLGA